MKNLGKQEIQSIETCLEPISKYLAGEASAVVAVLGSISSGKSSMLNALLGNVLLPSNAAETTQFIMSLTPSD